VDDPKPLEERQVFTDSGWPDKNQLTLALIERHGREQPGQTVEMIAVEMGDKDAGQLVRRESRPA
jgi:hypothetical protein